VRQIQQHHVGKVDEQNRPANSESPLHRVNRFCSHTVRSVGGSALLHHGVPGVERFAHDSDTEGI
jgi:hypothetical protein